ncbi:MAG: MFS transporter, partial [Chloroflexota bacterium]|nr:MFS transporter [Chloroflexota bacterium]
MTDATRPHAMLPWKQLGLISAYWFGINAVWGGYEAFGQKQVELIVGSGSVGSVMGVLELVAAMVPILVVPMAGALSDYTTTRWGKRKAYIITGTTFDLIFIACLSFIAMEQPPGWEGEALGTTGLIVLYGALLIGLQFSSNLAQGPYQGFVPDLVAEKQVGVASGLVGIMRVVGLIAGIGVMAAGARFELWGAAFLTVGLIEFVLGVLTFIGVDNGPPAKPREGRSWASIALETWDLDILRERSFVRMTLVRLFFLMGAGMFINISLLYIERVFSITDKDERSILWMAALGLGLAGTVLAAIPAARISDRIGRKPVVWGAAVVAATGVLILAVAPTPLVAVAGAFFLGAGYGAYLAVDWALMTDIIPLASSGRFMGIANIANSISGPLGLAVAGPIMDAFYRAGDIAMGPRVAVGLGVIALALASVILIGVHPRRDPRHPGDPAGAE